MKKFIDALGETCLIGTAIVISVKVCCLAMRVDDFLTSKGY